MTEEMADEASVNEPQDAKQSGRDHRVRRQIINWCFLFGLVSVAEGETIGITGQYWSSSVSASHQYGAYHMFPRR